ncbi:MAG: FtsQ-type POTRA domain-containing protein [Lawsonibacter sp.]|nr:FtsQ-type POTRA domain-containing protein [Lawsonibacter sp.]
MSRRSSRSRTHRRNRGRFGPLFKLLCVLAVGVALTVGATVFFRVESVTVSGNQRYSQEEIIAASGIQLGDNLYGLNKVRIGRSIRTSLPYIGKLSINRAPPSAILITVTEWEAVARIAVPEPEQAAAVRSGAGEEGADSGSQPPEPVPVAQEPWLINIEAKLLEPAPPDSSAILVSGLTSIAPEAGSRLKVPESEETRLEALIRLLEALEAAELSTEVSSVHLDATQLTLRYADRFNVKIKLDGNFDYSLRVMKAVRENREAQDGPDARGSIDLTQEGFEAVYSAEK